MLLLRSFINGKCLDDRKKLLFAIFILLREGHTDESLGGGIGGSFTKAFVYLVADRVCICEIRNPQAEGEIELFQVISAAEHITGKFIIAVYDIDINRALSCCDFA